MEASPCELRATPCCVPCCRCLAIGRTACDACDEAGPAGLAVASKGDPGAELAGASGAAVPNSAS
eukprot:14308772-Alexandrium_andersonii.AAC.1